MRKKSAAAKITSSNPEATWFGYEPVTAAQKTARVRQVFSSVAAKYDVMNDLMSFGIHRLWKRQLLRRVRPQAGQDILDVAGGTGDVALAMLRATAGAANITVCDASAAMMQVGQARAIDAGWPFGINWVAGDAAALPFSNSDFDVYTISFGLRNVTRIDDALREAARVLRPGGRFFCLEFSPAQPELLRQFYDAYSFSVLPVLGRLVAGDGESYQYLAESIRQFPTPSVLANRMMAAGFGAVRYELLTGGIVAIHSGIRV